MIDDSSSGGIHSSVAISMTGHTHIVQRSYKKREIYTYNNGKYERLIVHPPPLLKCIHDEEEEEEEEEEKKIVVTNR
jgi:hypothetical protein